MIPVIFEDPSLLVIDKPAGVTVNKADTTKNQLTIEDQLPQSRLPRRGIVHRLDKDTSGLLLVAKTADALKSLQAQFRKRQVKKTYLALVHGQVEPKSGNINLPVGRNPLNRQRFTVLITGRSATTDYQTVKTYPGYSLLAVFPKTGRTHQIRIHFKHLNHPVVADPLYLGKKRLVKDLAWCPRLFLHSHKISFTHPQNHRIINLEAPLPYDLQAALEAVPA